MCDTMGFINYNKKEGFFAKNSDREPEELQILKIVDNEYLDTLNNAVNSGYESFTNYLNKELIEKKKEYLENNINYLYKALLRFPPQYKAFVSTPAWLWGGEMGVNENGVSIGNEAVFSFEKVDNKGIIGMDILKVTLLSSKTANEALKIIIDLIENIGQGGNGGYKHKMKYHNSFLIQDFNEIYVLETSKNNWVYKKIENSDDLSFHTISNAYTITDDYAEININNYNRINIKKTKTVKNIKNLKNTENTKEVNLQSSKNANTKNFNSKKINFKKHYENKFFTFFAQGNKRYNYTYDYLNRYKETIDIKKIFNLLRSHAEDIKNFYKYNQKIDTGFMSRPSKTMGSICIHSGFIKSQTSASFIVQYINDNIDNNINDNFNDRNFDNNNNDNNDNNNINKKFILWFTGSPHPCISLFKPIVFDKNTFLNSDIKEKFSDIQYFKNQYKHSTEMVKNYSKFLSNLKQQRDEIEEEYIETVKNNNLNYKHIFELEKKYMK